MTDKTKIILIYATVVVVGVVTVGTSMWISKKRKEMFRSQPMAVEFGKDEPDVLRELEGDLEGTIQTGETVRLSELDDKVWVVTQFFANCPLCLQQNSQDLIALYEEFGSHPDFQMVSISVDPERDTVDFLADYAEAVGVEGDNWWFLRGDKEEVYRYLTEEMKYAPIVERPGAEGAERFGHDFGVQVYARGRRLIRQRDLAGAKKISAEFHQAQFDSLRERIALRLETPLPEDAEVETAGVE